MINLIAINCDFLYNQTMQNVQKYYRQSATYKIFSEIADSLILFLSNLGNITLSGLKVLKYILKGEVDFKELIEQCNRFGVSSLPITLSIV